MKKNVFAVSLFIFLFLCFFLVFGQEENAVGDDLLVTINKLIEKQEGLEKKSDKLAKEPGIKINGNLNFSATDILFMGNGSKIATNSETGETMRFRPMTQYLDLIFNTFLNEKIYIEGTFRVENIIGGYWGAYGMYGIKKLFAKGEIDFVDFYLGDFPAKLTSFTLAPVEKKYQFESEIFKWKREDNKKELNLINNSWPLSGIAISKKLNIFENILDLNYNIYAAFLGREGAYNIKIYDYELQAFVPYIYDHNQFLYSLTPGLNLFNIADIKYTYLKIFDAKDSGMRDKPAKENTVMSIAGRIDLVRNILNIYGEYAKAYYDPAVDYRDSTITGFAEKTGNAFKIEGEIIFESIINFISKIILKGGWLQVDKDFVSYGSQTRIYDALRNNQFILTQNNTWNVNSSGLNPQSYEIAGGIYPLTRYNNCIIVGLYLPYDIREELAFPYGEATPNRQGLFFSLNFDIINNLKLFASYALPSEIEKEKQLIDPLSGEIAAVNEREFQVINGGFSLNIFNMLLTGGILKESVENSGKLYPASMEILTIDGGLKYNFLNNIYLLAGIKLQKWNGKEIVSNVGKVNLDGNVNYYGAGIEYKIYEQVFVKLSYTVAEYVDLKNKGNNFNTQEVDFIASLNF